MIDSCHHRREGARPGQSHLAPLRAGARIAAAALCGLLVSALLPEPAPAVVPPYAEEWDIPAVPEDVEVDPSGRIWVSCGDDSIRIYTPTGGELLFAFGGTGAGDGEFQTPYGIAFDPSGEAYICDYAGARVQKFTDAGTFLLSWPIPSVRSDHVAVDGAGDVYVTGYTDLSVHKYTALGVPVTDWTSNGGTTTSGIIEAGGAIHVVQWDGPNVEQFATDGTFLGSFDAGTIGGTDVEADAVNQLWIADYGNHRVRIFTTDGVHVDDLGAFGSGPGELNGAIGVALGSDGSIYVADEGNSRVQRFGDSAPGGLTGTEISGWLSRAPSIRSIAPNPCRYSTELTYSLPNEDEAQLSIFDARGRRVATIAEGRMAAGTHRISWAPPHAAGSSGLAAGVYLVRLVQGRHVVVERLTIVR